MDHATLHERLAALEPSVLLGAVGRPGAPHGDPVEALERHASLGCSPCARALVNAREYAVVLAAAAARGGVRPSAGLRARVLAAARVGAPRAARAQAAEGAAAPLRDPSATVAHLHLAGPDEEGRAREVDALDALAERPGDGTARALAQLARLVGYPILFLSVVRGDRVGYRAQHGLDPGLAGSRRIRREVTYCTHCVSGGAPLVVEDAAAEPFFRGSRMVRRYGIRAYAGVPLRTSAGVVIGTLCALDVAPRRRDPDVVRLLQLYAEPALAEIELARGAARRDALLERLEGGREIYAAGWFSRLLAIELARAARGRPAALVHLPGAEPAAAAALAAPGEVLGRLDGGGLALLLSGAGPAEAEARCAAVRRGVPRAAWAAAERAGAGAAWARRARQDDG